MTFEGASYSRMRRRFQPHNVTPIHGVDDWIDSMSKTQTRTRRKKEVAPSYSCYDSQESAFDASQDTFKHEEFIVSE